MTYTAIPMSHLSQGWEYPQISVHSFLVYKILVKFFTIRSVSYSSIEYGSINKIKTSILSEDRSPRVSFKISDRIVNSGSPSFFELKGVGRIFLYSGQRTREKSPVRQVRQTLGLPWTQRTGRIFGVLVVAGPDEYTTYVDGKSFPDKWKQKYQLCVIVINVFGGLLPSHRS